MKNHSLKFKIIYLTIFFTAVLLLPKISRAANWYVDNTASGSNNGTSWANAWTSMFAITGVSSGDTVYVSGGPVSGGGQTYNATGNWAPAAGVIYRIGQDASHGGMATFDGGNYYQGMPSCCTAYNNVAFDGGYNGQSRFTFKNFSGHQMENVNSTGFVVKYSNIYGSIGIGGASLYEIAYNEFYPPYMADTNIQAAGQVSNGEFGLQSIHHNHFRSYFGSNGYGADFIQGGTSVDIYNNHFEGIYTTEFNLLQQQHPDGMQSCPSYAKIYNNVFENIGNAPLFCNQQTSADVTMQHVKIYNNVVLISDTRTAGFGFQFGRTSGTGTVTFDNIIVANNTFFTTASSIDMKKSIGVVFTNSSVYNNLAYNQSNALSYAYAIDPDVNGYNSATNINVGGRVLSSFTIGTGNKTFTIMAGFATYNNGDLVCIIGNNSNYMCGTATGYSGGVLTVNVTSTVGSGTFNNGRLIDNQCGNHFTSCQTLSGNGYAYDFHLQNGDVLFKDTGTSMAAYFTVDKDGISRPQGVAWDIGAYEYVGTAPPDTTPPAAPIGLAVI